MIPPNKDMSILHGVLHLLEPVAPRGLRLPIDFFFRSLADDRQDRSIGVILSGMGSDGTLGLRAIKEKAGVVLRAGRRPRPSSTACRAAPSTPGWPTWSPRWRSCRARSSPISSTPLRSPSPDSPRKSKTQSALEKVVYPAAGPDRP